MAPRIAAWLDGVYGPGAGRLILPFYLVLLTALTFYVLRRLLAELKAEGIPREAVLDCFLVTLVFFFIGARLMAVPMEPESFSGRWWRALAFWNGGFSSQGAVLGSAVGGFGAVLYKRLPARRLADAITPFAFLALAYSRLGCFLKGCCFGLPSDLPWSVRYPRGSFAFLEQMQTGLIDRTARLSAAVHPTPLYEALLGLALFMGLLRLDQRRPAAGTVMSLGVMSYGAARLGLDFLRADASPGWLGLSHTQLAGAVMVAAGGGFALWLRQSSRSRP